MFPAGTESAADLTEWLLGRHCFCE